MLTTKIPLIVILIGFTSTCCAQDEGDRLTDAQEKYNAGDLDGALQQLEPLLGAGAIDQSLRQRGRQMAALVLHVRGEQHFRQARIPESIADFDREVQLQPVRAPAHWQRGIAYYYAGDYDKGARQFELHQTVNPQDVENAAWHFLCMARAKDGSVEAARKKLIPITRDERVPMAQIHKLFAGAMTPEEVLRAGEEAKGSAKFYADLYVGLYYEAIEQNEESLRLLAQAAGNPAAKDGYMGDVARVHLILRKRKQEPPTSHEGRQLDAGEMP